MIGVRSHVPTALALFGLSRRRRSKCPRNLEKFGLFGLLNAPHCDDANFLSLGNEAFAEMKITALRFLNNDKVENGHLSASLDFVTSAPRQSALSRERQRLSVSTLTLWPTFETG